MLAIAHAPTHISQAVLKNAIVAERPGACETTPAGRTAPRRPPCLLRFCLFLAVIAQAHSLRPAQKQAFCAIRGFVAVQESVLEAAYLAHLAFSWPLKIQQLTCFQWASILRLPLASANIESASTDVDLQRSFPLCPIVFFTFQSVC